MNESLRARSPAEVVDDHLRRAGEHRFAEDIECDFAPDVAFLETIHHTV